MSQARNQTASSGFATAISNDRPSAYYRLDDTGASAADATANRLSGAVGSSVVKNAASLVASTNDAAMDFPGIRSSAGIVKFPQSSKLQPSKAVSLELLLRFPTTPANYTVPAAYGTDRGYAPYDVYFVNGKLMAQFYLSSGVLVIASPSALKANTTYHIVSTFDGSTARLYLNGSLVASRTKAGSLTGYVRGYGLAIGDDAGLSDPAFKGTIDDVAVYANQALTAAQVTSHYAAATSGVAAPAPSSAPTNRPTAAPVPKPSPVATYVPTPAPTQAPIPSGSGNVAHYQGCPIFAAGGPYNAPITNASVDPNDANYINSMVRAGNTPGFWASTGVEFVNVATSGTSMTTVHPKVAWHSFPVQYPWASSYKIEPLGDAHAMVLDTATCHLYESYSTSFSGGALSAYSGANWNTTQPFVSMRAGSPSAMASGLSIFGGMVKWEEVQSGTVNHALNWAATAHTVSQWGFVSPASSTDGLPFTGSSSYQLPYGAHLRLKASFDTSRLGPQAKIVAQAMKTYGIYLSDTGSSGNALYFANALNGSNPWNRSDLSTLGTIHISDFDVLKLPPMQRVPGH
ncbi:MAG TPA: LamG-like jellyroll fold domain-containing protein [Candidatus Baltobacteraceae bacterium]